MGFLYIFEPKVLLSMGWCFGDTTWNWTLAFTIGSFAHIKFILYNEFLKTHV